MTKIKVVSDLHLEFADIYIPNNGCDVLILSGDITIAQELHDVADIPTSPYASVNIEGLTRRQQAAKRYRDFLARCSNDFEHVIYVAGNHEFYHGRWIESIKDLRNECAKFNNVYFLENDTKQVNDITFVGSTLWTDMNKCDPLTLHAVADMMNDFRIIRHDGLGFTKLRPMHVVERHKQSLDYIRHVIEGRFDDKFVVVGHHAPCKMSVKPRYEKDHLMNGAYSSDLTEFILDHPQIKLWTHGHTHDSFDYMVGTTRIVCNPRGYEGYEVNQGWDINNKIEV